MVISTFNQQRFICQPQCGGVLGFHAMGGPSSVVGFKVIWQWLKIIHPTFAAWLSATNSWERTHHLICFLVNYWQIGLIYQEKEMPNMFMSQCLKDLLYFSAMSYQPNNQNTTFWLGVGPVSIQWFCHTPQTLWALYHGQQAWGVSHHSQPVK